MRSSNTNSHVHETAAQPWVGRVPPAFIVIIAGMVAALHIGKIPPAIPVLRDALGVSLVEAGFLLSMVQMAGMLGVDAVTDRADESAAKDQKGNAAPQAAAAAPVEEAK